MTKRKPGAQPGNENALKHGGERAVCQLTAGADLTGLASDLRTAIHDRIETQGMVAVLRLEAERYLAVAHVFLGLLEGAQDEESFDRWAKRYGWLEAKAFRMLRDVHKLMEDGGGVIDYERILEEKRRNG